MTQVAVTVSLWERLLEEVRGHYSPEIYQNWFAPLKVHLDDEGRFVLCAPNDFAAIWIEDNFAEMIQERLSTLAEAPTSVLVQGEQPQAAPVSDARLQDRGAPSPGETGTGPTREREGLVRTTGRKRSKVYLNPRNTFENFVVGPSNQLAHAAAIAVAAEPGKAYNPLFLYGETGLGKTHIMHSIAHAIQQRQPDAHVVYVTCERFTNKFLKAIRENTLDAFRRFYRKVDLLLIDDVQFLSGKERTQEEFFHTFNELFESQRQLCLSSDRPASEIAKLESRLISRFQWGMVTDIQSPDLETRVAILKKKALAMGHDNLSEEVLGFLASRITRNIRRLEGALIKVAAYGRLTHRAVDVETAEGLIQDILQEESLNQITIEKIQRTVVDFFELRMSDMISKRRPHNIAFPRQIAMYLSRLHTSHPLKEIGEAFGGRDHGTVIHACRTVEDQIDQDEKIRRNIEYLSKQLRG